MTTNVAPERIIFRKGKKVILRPYEELDALRVTRWMNDPETTRHLLTRFPQSLAAEREWITKQPSRHPNDIVFAIETLDGVHIGSMGLHRIDWINRLATTGAVIGEAEYRGKGYGTDAKMLLLEYAFNALQLHKIMSHVIDTNLCSQRYSEKCGYKVEGMLKQHHFLDGAYHDEVIMAVFREDWLPMWNAYMKD